MQIYFFGRVGVRDNRKREIPMEVLDDNGEYINESNAVFDKRKTEFSALLNSTSDHQIDQESITLC